MTTPIPYDLLRTWLFGPGADRAAHAAMQASGADALILDLEDFTPPGQRARARAALAEVLAGWRAAGAVTAVRINPLDAEGPQDLEAALAAGAQVIAYPMAALPEQMQALDAAVTAWEARQRLPAGLVTLLPVCETALGVVNVRALAAASPRVRAALLGTEDLANDLCAERTPQALELAAARGRFILDCRAAGIEPIDAPYTYGDTEGAVREAMAARGLGYRSKALVRPEHARALNRSLTPDAEALRRARAQVRAFEAARARGEERALLDGLWIEVPTYRNATRLLARAERLAARA
jgi:citrate lyase subunit beta/citryl-CoA lyase